MDARQSARWLAGAWCSAVFPLVPDSKAPATPHGFQDASADPEEVDRWPPATTGYGVACGASGLVVVDVDTKASDHPEVFGLGVTGWCGLLAANTDPDTLEVVTARGGMHAYFLAPAAVELRNSASKLAPSVDVRATGGYVVGPGSVVGGRRYEVVRRFAPAPCPPWLVTLLTRKVTAVSKVPAADPGTSSAYGRRALESELGRLALAREGSRNQQLNSSAFALAQLVAGGVLDGKHVANELERVARAIGLDGAEVVATIRSGFRSGLAQPRRAS